MIEYTREDIIEALEHLLSPVCTETQFDYCGEIRAAIALLKEQEPRVIYDASEIKLDTVYWMEKKNIVTPWPVAMKMYSQRLPEQLEFEDYYGERWTVSRYLVGKEGWRLWTARPTDEQRREASWHG